MDYGFLSNLIVCFTAFMLVLNIVYPVVSRRRAQKLGILSIKYPICDSRTALSAFVAALGILWMFASIAHFPNALADYQASFEQDPELYSHLIEKTEDLIEKDKFHIVIGAAVAVIELLSIFTRGAYITKDGVMFFGSLEPQSTSARIEEGAIKFYTRTSHETENDRPYRHAFDLPENEDNLERFNRFITTDANA